MHASAFLCLLMLPFSHGVCVYFACLNGFNAIFWKKNVLPLKKIFFVVSIKINLTFLFGMKVYWYKNKMGEFQLLNFRPGVQKFLLTLVAHKNLQGGPKVTSGF